MPSKKPSQERIQQTLGRFQMVETKTLESNKERYFRLPYEAALAAVDAELSKTAYRLWIYLSANYPFGDCDVDLPSQTELAIRLNVTRQSINIAAAELQAAGLWDFWPERWKGRNLKGFNCSTEEGVEKSRQVSKKSDTLSKKSDTRCQKKSIPCQKNLTPYQKNPTPSDSKLSLDKGYSADKTIQTYTDFIQTLSEDERESFEKFVKEEWKRLTAKNGESGEIISLERFLAREEDIKNWYDRFLNSPAGREAKRAAIASTDWTQNPDWGDWLAQMREGVPRFVALGTCFDNKTRRAIADWADERGLIWGTES